MKRQYGLALGGCHIVDYALDVRFERTTILSSGASGDIVPCTHAKNK